MIHVKSAHNRPVRVGRLLWRPGQVHPVMEHWLNKTVMRALIRKGWLEVMEPSVPPPPVSEVAGVVKPEAVEKKEVPAKAPEPPKPEEKPIVDFTKNGPVNVAGHEPARSVAPTEAPEMPVEEPEEEKGTEGQAEPEEATVGESEATEALSREALETMAFKDLRDLGQKLGVGGRSKEDLIDRIESAQADGKSVSGE